MAKGGREKIKLQSTAGTGHLYTTDKNKKTTPEKIDAVAQGRVWTGQQAKERGLVDTLGSYSDAIKSAADRAKIADSYTVSYVETEPTGIDRFFRFFDTSSLAQTLAQRFNIALLPTGIPPQAVKDMTHDMRWLSDMTDRNKSFSVVTHCMCDVP